MDFRLASMFEQYKFSIFKHWDEIAKSINVVAKAKNLSHGYFTLFELQKIPKRARMALLRKIQQQRITKRDWSRRTDCIMRMRQIRFDDPESLEKSSNLCSDFVMSIQLLDYARRRLERDGDTRRAKELRKYFKKVITDYVYVVRAIVTDELISQHTQMFVKHCEKLRTKTGVAEDEKLR